MMMIVSVVSVFAIIVIFKINCSNEDSNKYGNLKVWFNKVKSPSFNCSHMEYLNVENKNSALVEIIDCAETGAIYEYNFKLLGTKNKKNRSFHGFGTLQFGDLNDNNSAKLFGLKNKKCLRSSIKELASISGYFENDILKGEVSMNFQNGTFARGYAEDGVLIGIVRHFSKHGQLTKIIDNLTYFEAIGSEFMYYILPSTKTNGKHRKLITKNMAEVYSCIQIDMKFFVECFKLKDDNHLQINGCKMEWDSSQVDIPEETFNIIISPENKMQFHSECQKPFCVDYTGNFSIRSSLEHWINTIENHHSYFSKNFYPIDPQNPNINISIHHIRNRPGLMKSLNVAIETPFGFTLFEGTMKNGHLAGKVDKHLVNHPGWKTRLNIQIETKRGKDLFVRSTLKNGKLHGMVQIYGILSRNFEGRCSDIMISGLSFVGHFENGSPVGPCWRQLVGGSWLYGTLNENQEFSGTDIAYLHQDLQLVMIGEFRNGIMLKGQEAEIIGEKCNEFGIKTLEFSQPIGPIFHHMDPSNTTFGDQPKLRDPLAKKYIYLKSSEEFSSAEEGLFASKNIEPNTIFVQYSGMLYDQYQDHILRLKIHQIRVKNNWVYDDPRSTELWKYKHNLSKCGYTIDIPSPEYKSTKRYQGTLGHKINHKFDPNSIFIHYDTPRFGIVVAIKTTEYIFKDQELFAHYGYSFKRSPRWYRNLFRQYAREKPTESNLKKLDELNEAENLYAHGKSEIKQSIQN